MSFLKKIVAAFYAVGIMFGEILFGFIGVLLSLWDVGTNAYEFYLEDPVGPEETEKEQNG